MINSALRWVGGGLVLFFIVGAVLTVSQCRDSLREEGRQEVTKVIQQETIDNLLEDREVTSRVLLEREQQRARHEASSTQAQKEIHEAKPTEAGIDRPLPDSLVSPLLMQYQAITCSQGGEDTAACGLDDGAGYSCTATSGDGAKFGSLDQ